MTEKSNTLPADHPDKTTRLPNDHPQHYTKKATFRRYSWWRSQDGRVFVITSREEHPNGDIYAINLLETDKEDPVCRPYEEILDLYNRGVLEQTSKMPV